MHVKFRSIKFLVPVTDGPVKILYWLAMSAHLVFLIDIYLVKDHIQGILVLSFQSNGKEVSDKNNNIKIFENHLTFE